ncbi:MAG: CDP-diacylglycerol--serine O-phosphatidyltransferase [Synergistaceae bacterium]|nr:CDP-diacylglycerol--serine O-phosphatidyltransferase [Synergistaceae bacterium]
MVTSGNLLCGMMALMLLYGGRPVPAAWLVFAAVFFDILDGKVARSLGGGTRFGLEFASLADMVSFGVAPAMLIYSDYMGALGLWGVLSGSYFTLCGGLRLARFNIINMPGPFQGLPIPAGGLFLTAFVLAGAPLHPAAAAFICVAAGSLMISSVPYGNLKGLKASETDIKKWLLLAAILAACFMFLKSWAPLAAITIYVFSGPVRFDWGKWLSGEKRVKTAGKKI